MTRGDLVQAWYDTGAFGPRIMVGVIEKCGQKTMTIRWESGARNRIPRGSALVELISDPDLRGEARKKLGRHGN